MCLKNFNLKTGKEEEEKTEHSESGHFSNSSSAGSISTPYNRRPGPAAITPIGYTIGATNVLFKQRLYDDIDVFVDETSIDMKQNEQLKRQLQLTTADLRFADYLIKNVNANRSMQPKSSHNTPTLLSVKKTSNSFGKYTTFSDTIAT